MSSPLVKRVLVHARPRHSRQRQTVRLDWAELSQLFHLKQTEAADYLGISLTSLKSASRKLGLERWPYLRDRPLANPPPPSLQQQQPEAAPSHAPCSRQDPADEHTGAASEEQQVTLATSCEAGWSPAEGLSRDFVLLFGSLPLDEELEGCGEGWVYEV